MLNVQVEGEWKQFPKGTRLIEACMKSGHFIPHYCYHPKLSSPGNCRMCLVELGMPKMTPERKLGTGRRWPSGDFLEPPSGYFLRHRD